MTAAIFLSCMSYEEEAPPVLNELTLWADFNGDGLSDFFDVSAFLNAFSAGSSAADLTGDGMFDFFDVSAFLSAFGAGCP